MRDSLTILLPVHNRQSRLESLVVELLDVACDLTHALELTIVDDGSNDGTEEIAWELAVRYLQVDCVRHPFRLGHQKCIRTGMLATRGEYVLVCDGNEPLDTERLVFLWRDRHNAVPADSPETMEAVALPLTPKFTRSKKSWRQQLVHYCQSLRKHSQRFVCQPGLYLLRRSDLAETGDQVGLSRLRPSGNLADKRYRADRHSSARPSEALVLRSGHRLVDAVVSTATEPTREFREAMDRLKQGARGV